MLFNTSASISGKPSLQAYLKINLTYKLKTCCYISELNSYIGVKENLLFKLIFPLNKK